MSYLTRTALLGFLTAIVFFSRSATADIVITEILYTADPTNLGGEFLELHNNGSASVEVGNWVITDAVDFTFPTGTSIEAGEYIVVARNKAEAETFYGVSVLGEYVGALSNGGDRILLAESGDPVEAATKLQMRLLQIGYVGDVLDPRGFGHRLECLSLFASLPLGDSIQ